MKVTFEQVQRAFSNNWHKELKAHMNGEKVETRGPGSAFWTVCSNPSFGSLNCYRVFKDVSRVETSTSIISIRVENLPAKFPYTICKGLRQIKLTREELLAMKSLINEIK